MENERHPLIDATPGNGLVCEDHKAYVLLPYRLAIGASSDYRAPAQALHHALTTPPDGAKQALWQPVDRASARNSLHQDLLPVIDQILHGGPESADDAIYHGHTALRLELQTLPEAYLMAFRESALLRLQRAGVQAQSALVQVKGATLYTFPTGIVIVAVALRFSESSGASAVAKTVPAALTLEALYALGHAADRGNDLRPVEFDRRVVAEELVPGDRVVLDKDAGFAARRWRPEDGEASVGPAKARRLLLIEPTGSMPIGAGKPVASTLVFERGEPISMVDVVNGWLSAAGTELLAPARSAEHGRLFTFFVGLYGESLSSVALPELAYRMSRRYSADYKLPPGAAESAVLCPFDNVCHAVSTQSAAVAVRDTGGAFIERFVDSAIAPAYLPMAVVSFHEYVHLLHLTQGIARLPNEKEPRADRDRLQNLRAALVAFRLYFRFSHVSDLSHHNQVHALWRHELDLDRIAQELTLDVREGEQVLERLHREEEGARRHAQDEELKKRTGFWKKWGITGLALGQIYLLIHIFEAVIELIYPRKWLNEWLTQAHEKGGLLVPEAIERALQTYHTAHVLEIIATFVAVGIGIWLGIAAHRSGSGGGGH